MIARVLEGLFGTGGLLRVRAFLALALTGVGGGYLLVNGEMPPAEYNVLWTAAVMSYFGERASKGSVGVEEPPS